MIFLSLMVLLNGCGGDSGPTGNGGNFDASLVATWHLFYFDEDGDSEPWTGTIIFQSNGNFSAEFHYYSESVTFSGNASTASSKLTTNVTETSNPEWIETGTTIWDYSIQGEQLTMETDVEGSIITMKFSKSLTAKGTLEGYVFDLISQAFIEDALIEIQGKGLSSHSNSSGYYTIAGIDTGTYSVTASKTGYETGTFNQVAISSSQTTTLDILLIPEGYTNYGTLEGKVTAAASGTPLAYVLIEVQGTSNYGYSITDGTYKVQYIPGGTYTVKFSKSGYTMKSVDNVVVQDGKTTTLNVEMESGAGTGYLFCYVYNSSTLKPINQAKVEVLSTAFSGTTTMLGTCTIQNIPVGTYTLRISKTGFVTRDIENVGIVDLQTTNQNIALVPE
jgi:hypothetical protein